MDFTRRLRILGEGSVLLQVVVLLEIQVEVGFLLQLDLDSIGSSSVESTELLEEVWLQPIHMGWAGFPSAVEALAKGLLTDESLEIACGNLEKGEIQMDQNSCKDESDLLPPC